MERLLRETPNDSTLALFLAKQLIRYEDSRPEGIRNLAKLSTSPTSAVTLMKAGVWRWSGPVRRVLPRCRCSKPF